MPMSQTEVANWIGVSQQLLSYWLRTGLIEDVPGGEKPCVPLQFYPRHVMQALTVQELRQQGAPVPAIRRAITALREKRDVEHWAYEWLGVTPDGVVVWMNDKGQVMAPDDDQVYLLDLTGMREQAERKVREVEAAKA